MSQHRSDDPAPSPWNRGAKRRWARAPFVLGEGRRWFNFASSDYHRHYTAGGDDFYPGEYQKTWTYVVDGDRDGDYSFQEIAAGLPSGSSFHVMGESVRHVALTETAPNPVPLQPNQSLLSRIREREVIRIGYNADKLPCAYFNVRGDLVGFDINLAHELARDLDVAIEFVPFDRTTRAEQLREDDFDIVMSGLVGTLERSEAMMHTRPYLDVTLSFVVEDYRVRSFALGW